MKTRDKLTMYIINIIKNIIESFIYEFRKRGEIYIENLTIYHSRIKMAVIFGEFYFMPFLEEEKNHQNFLPFTMRLEFFLLFILILFVCHEKYIPFIF